MPRLKDQAICIRHLDWSETSQVVVLMSERHGKVRGLAKGSKRMSPSHMQRFSGGIELLTRGEVVATTKPTAELATITEWDLQADHYHLRRDLAAHRLGLYAADAVHALSAELDPHPGTYHALRTVLEALADPSARTRALLRFQWALLEDAGYRPELERDVQDNTPLPAQSTYRFDPHRGGLTSQERVGDADWRVRRETVELLRALGGEGVPDTADAGTIDRANRLLCAYLRAILDRELPTMRYVLAPALERRA